ECIDFEDLTAGDRYVVGDTFLADATGFQAKITGEPFQWSNGIFTSGGFTLVEPGNMSGEVGQDMQVNNILLHFDFGGPVDGLTMSFGEYGGNLNLEINGDFHNFEDFQDVNGLNIGGTLVQVIGGTGNGTGELIVSGTVNSFKVGGQELWIDHICPAGDIDQGEFDWGDAPERPYPTTSANNGARHRIDREVFLGDLVEPEKDGQPSVAADGDDLTTSDDEDGVRFLTPLIPGQMAQVEVIASTDGWLNAWVDFDRDGNWTNGTAENVFSAQPIAAGVNVLNFIVPATAKPGPNEATYSRWRFSTTHKLLNPDATNPADESPETPNGEVEDHLAFIQDPPNDDRQDWGDAPESYRTLQIHNGPVHLINPDVFLGTRIDAEPDGQPSPMANRDDANTVDDEDGVHFLTPLIPGQMAQVEVTASVDGWLNAWIDFDADGSFAPGGPEEIFSGQFIPVGSTVLNFAVPASAKVTQQEPTMSRWRFSTTDTNLQPWGISPTGATPDGEVEDHPVRIIEDPNPEPRFDWGDARQAYPTLAANNGARHLINPDLFMGSKIDGELDGAPSFLADGDDNATSDDEDGVRFLTPLVPGMDAKVEVVSSMDAKLDAWVDFNQDGSWDPTEQIVISEPTVAGSNTYSFVVPNTALPTPTRPTYARFRLSSNGGLGPAGAARDGEVEDYMILNGDLNHDGSIGHADVDLLCDALHAGDTSADLNGDGSVSPADMDYLIHNILGTHYGDANLDGDFNSTDLVQVFSMAEYEDGVPGNSTWADGDWNCDGEFDSGDLVKAFADGGYSEAAVANRTNVDRIRQQAAAVDSVFAEHDAPHKSKLQHVEDDLISNLV
ncbi:MAG: hypothetical protein KDA87_21560, partial [Planctomycetales bacterium]|nr:hypothetical protein [Planctomycetales bacterium]